MLVTIIGLVLLRIPKATQKTQPKKLIILNIDILLAIKDSSVSAVAIHPMMTM
jgi:hypothetical protein